MIVKAIIRDWDGNALIGERHDELKSTYYKDFGFNFEGVDGSISHGTKTSTQYTFTIRAGTSTTDFWSVEQIVPSSYVNGVLVHGENKQTNEGKEK